MARQYPNRDYYHGGYGPCGWTTQAPLFDNTFPFWPTMPTYHTAPPFMPQPGPWNYTQQYWDPQTFGWQHLDPMPAMAPLHYPDSFTNSAPHFTAHPSPGFIMQPPAPSNNHHSPVLAPKFANLEQSLTVRAKKNQLSTTAPVATTSTTITKPPTIKHEKEALSALKPELSGISKRPAAEKRKAKRERQKFKFEQTERMLERAFKGNDYDAESTLKAVKSHAVTALGPVIHKDASHKRLTRSMTKDGRSAKGPTPPSAESQVVTLSQELYDRLWARACTERQDVRTILDGSSAVGFIPG